MLNNTTEKLLERKTDILLGRLTYLLSWIIVLGLVIAASEKSIWADEVFSVRLAQQSVRDIIALTARDVHPPLYYLLLKSGIYVGNQLIGLNIMYVSKLVSVLPYLLFLSVWGTAVRKEKGIYYSGITAFLVVSMPNFLNYGLEVRMYSWALLFVVMAYISSLRIVKYNLCRDWFFLVISSILAAYTHYFAAIAVSVIYIYLFFMNLTKIKRWIISVFITSILYCPWILVLFGQLKMVKESYWIQGITLADIKGFLYYAVAPPFGFFHVDEVEILLVGLVILISLIKFVFEIKKKKDTTELMHALLGCIVTGLTVFFGVIVSVFYRPVFISRYMFPSLGCFWLGIGGILFEFKKKKFGKFILFLLIPSCMLNIVSFAKTEMRYQNDYIKMCVGGV